MSDYLKLWKECGGDQHGPIVEHVTMPLTNFTEFCQRVQKPLHAALAAERERVEAWKDLFSDEAERTNKLHAALSQILTDEEIDAVLEDTTPHSSTGSERGPSKPEVEGSSPSAEAKNA